MSSTANDVSKGLSIFTWAQTLMLGVAQYTQSFSKFAAGIIGGVTSFFDIYGAIEAYRNPEFELQRKTKILTFFLSFALNCTYTIGSVLKAISNKLLGVIAVGIDVVTLSRLSYITHQARISVRIVKRELHDLQEAYDPYIDTLRAQGATIESVKARLDEARDVSFRSKAEVAHTTISLLTSIMFVGGFFFPPLFTVGLVTLIASKIVHFIDTKTDLGISHAVGNFFKKCFPKKEKKIHREYQGYKPVKFREKNRATLIEGLQPTRVDFRFKQHTSNHYGRLMHHPDKLLPEDLRYLPSTDPVLRLSS